MLKSFILKAGILNNVWMVSVPVVQVLLLTRWHLFFRQTLPVLTNTQRITKHFTLLLQDVVYLQRRISSHSSMTVLQEKIWLPPFSRQLSTRLSVVLHAVNLFADTLHSLADLCIFSPNCVRHLSVHWIWMMSISLPRIIPICLQPLVLPWTQKRIWTYQSRRCKSAWKARLRWNLKLTVWNLCLQVKLTFKSLKSGTTRIRFPSEIWLPIKERLSLVSMPDLPLQRQLLSAKTEHFYIPSITTMMEIRLVQQLLRSKIFTANYQRMYRLYTPALPDMEKLWSKQPFSLTKVK